MNLWLAVMLQVAPMEIRAMRLELVGQRHRLLLEADRDWGVVPVRREGLELIVSLPSVSEPPTVPLPSGPITGLRLAPSGAALELRLTVAADVPFELQRNGSQLAIVFGSAPATKVPEGISPQLLALYHSLRPPTASPADTPRDAPSPHASEELPGVGIGGLRFQPLLLIGYAKGQTAIDSPTAVEDSYLHIEPRLGTQLILFDGRVRANYEPQLRFRSKFAKVNRPSHEANLRVEVPIGTRFVLEGNEHYATSTLDTHEVDPGREYFFDLGRFWRSDTSAQLRIEVGPRLRLIGNAGLNRIRFQEDASFFGYDQRRGGAALQFELSEGLRTTFSYAWERIPPTPERPVLNSRARSGTLTIRGEFPLLEADVAVGYRRQEAPAADEGGRAYEGLGVSGQIVKAFGPESRLTLSGGHGPYISAFENNAFYIASGVQLTVDTRIPLGLSARVGGGYHWNAYRTVSARIGEQRRDRLYGWTAGLSRTLTRWSYLRVDYAWDRRESNYPGLDNETTLLLAQVGIGLFGLAEQ